MIAWKSSMRKEVLEWFTVAVVVKESWTLHCPRPWAGETGGSASAYWEYQVLPSYRQTSPWPDTLMVVLLISPRHLTLDSCSAVTEGQVAAPDWLRDCNRAFWLAAAQHCVLPGDWAVVRGNHGQGRVSLDNWAWVRVHQITPDN